MRSRAQHSICRSDTAHSPAGVFVPFKIMFPDDKGVFEIPVVEVSISSDLRPETEYEIGKALRALRWVFFREF